MNPDARIAAAIGRNDEYATLAQIAKHRARQLNDEANLPNRMQHLHVLAKKEFAILSESVEITHSFELGKGIVARCGERDGAPIWLIENRPGNSCAALFMVSEPTERPERQPFESDHFVAIDFDVALQTINESRITDVCHMGGGITFHVGSRHGIPVYVLHNESGMCAAWYDDNYRH
jgi:hypothetical protein